MSMVMWTPLLLIVPLLRLTGVLEYTRCLILISVRIFAFRVGFFVVEEGLAFDYYWE